MMECIYWWWISLEGGRRQLRTGTIECPVAEARALINKFKKGDYVRAPKCGSILPRLKFREFRGMLTLLQGYNKRGLP